MTLQSAADRTTGIKDTLRLGSINCHSEMNLRHWHYAKRGVQKLTLMDMDIRIRMKREKGAQECSTFQDAIGTDAQPADLASRQQPALKITNTQLQQPHKDIYLFHKTNLPPQNPYLL